MSCLLRSRLARQTIDKYLVNTPKIIMLGSFRPINDSERPSTNTYSPSAKTEVDLFISACQSEFGATEYSSKYSLEQNHNTSWCEYIFNDKLSILSAPSSDPDRRANSADTYNFFLISHKIQNSTKILLVTSSIYAPYQHFEAIIIMGTSTKLDIETIGVPADWIHQNSNFMAEKYLQEIRSAILSAEKLLSMVESKYGSDQKNTPR